MWKKLLQYLLVLVPIIRIHSVDHCAIAREKQIAIGLDSTSPWVDYSIQMCNVTRSGLPKCSRCQTIAIIGAGISGLTAAVELARAGHRVAIYEASNRTGGRIFTYRKPGSDLLTELGAMRLPLNAHPLVRSYVQQRYNLTTARFTTSDENAYVFLSNVRQTVRQTELHPNAFGFDLTHDESKMVRSKVENSFFY